MKKFMFLLVVSSVSFLNCYSQHWSRCQRPRCHQGYYFYGNCWHDVPPAPVVVVYQNGYGCNTGSGWYGNPGVRWCRPQPQPRMMQQRWPQQNWQQQHWSQQGNYNQQPRQNWGRPRNGGYNNSRPMGQPTIH